MNKLTETMKQMLDALAFADAGDYLSGREKARVLRQKANPASIAPATPESTRARAGSTARRVALYLGSELPSTMMDYVIDTCSSLANTAPRAARAVLIEWFSICPGASSGLGV